MLGVVRWWGGETPGLAEEVLESGFVGSTLLQGGKFGASVGYDTLSPLSGM